MKKVALIVLAVLLLLLGTAYGYREHEVQQPREYIGECFTDGKMTAIQITGRKDNLYTGVGILLFLPFKLKAPVRDLNASIDRGDLTQVDCQTGENKDEKVNELYSFVNRVLSSIGLGL